MKDSPAVKTLLGRKANLVARRIVLEREVGVLDEINVEIVDIDRAIEALQYEGKVEE